MKNRKEEVVKMPNLEHQVLKRNLINPVRIALFDNDGIAREFIERRADKLRENLNKAGIRFAVTDRQPPIEIFIEKADMRKLKTSNIKLPTIFDLK